MKDKSGYTKIKTEIYCNMNFNLQKSPRRNKKSGLIIFLAGFFASSKEIDYICKTKNPIVKLIKVDIR